MVDIDELERLRGALENIGNLSLDGCIKVNTPHGLWVGTPDAYAREVLGMPWRAPEGHQRMTDTEIRELRAENARLREDLADSYVKLSGVSDHASDCATSSAPAITPGPCDCAVADSVRSAPHSKGSAMGIVERLRLVAAWHTPGGPTPKEPRGRIDNVCLAAIAEIERQANLIERLKGYAVHDDDMRADAIEAGEPFK